MIKKSLLLTVSAIAAITFGSPVSAQYKGTNEREWAASLQSDIRNGAPAEDICTNARSTATTSNEVAFKDWAYSVARQYCKEGFELKSNATEQSAPPGLTPKCSLSSADMYAISMGKKTVVQEGNCFMSFH